MTRNRILLIAAIVILAGGLFLFDAGRYFTLDFFRAQQEMIESWVIRHPVLSALGYFLLYVIIAGLSLPAAAILTLTGGALFGLLWGSVLASFASTIGATLAFLAARYLFRDLIQARYRDRLKTVNTGIREDGAFYLFTLRLIPLFPFFLVNLVMGLTPIRVPTFFLVSQAGMLIPTVIYVNAGTRLAAIEQPGDILSPSLIASLALLGVFPLLAKKTVGFVRARRARDREA